jgi:hypothetical protein
MRFTLKSGREIVAAVHDDWKDDCSMQTAALDLKSAYKQLPLNKQDADKIVVTLKDPRDSQVKFLLMYTVYSSFWIFGISATLQPRQLAAVGTEVPAWSAWSC